MAGLYIHFPFCKQACHYCNFHFSTQLKNVPDFPVLLEKELESRYTFIQNESIESIYFGGGSPSLMNPSDIQKLIQKAEELLGISSKVEITVELNPDDVSTKYLKGLQQVGVNRVSLGVQSFWESDLQMMNRAHNRKQALTALSQCQGYFENVSVDLIYGIPGSTLSKWHENLKVLASFEVPHVSAYALTVEPNTALAHQVKKNQVELLPEEEVAEQYELLLDAMTRLGFVNYKFSNFGQPGYFSINNSNYWNRKPYLGIGPGAHSYDGKQHRNWNVSNNTLYQKGISTGQSINTSEILTKKDVFNETIMTGLRTHWGVNRIAIQKQFGAVYAHHLETQVKEHLIQNNLFWDGDTLLVSRHARFLTDGIAADLFLVNLNS